MSESDQSEQLSRLLFQTLLYFERIHKEIRKFGTDTELHGAELNMISAIEENEGIHIIGLANVLGITRSAASQTLKRLSRKGIIEKRVDPENLSRRIIALSPKGKTVYRTHRALHKEFEICVRDCLKDTPETAAATISTFIRDLHTKVAEREKKGW
jgi:Transcriptional regulators